MAQAISKKETTQTAVEWMIEQISEKQSNGFYVIDTLEDVKRVFEQAKAMEKEQMYKCASFWRGKENEIEKPIFEQYYNENYGG